MKKSRNFTVYLLKTKFNPTNALKEDHHLRLLAEKGTNIPEKGIMYIGQNPNTSPWWKKYWGIRQTLNQTSVGAIVFLPISERWFAITFGMSFHCLKEDAYEYDFGLRVTLNTLDPEKIKSTDLLIPETAKRQRIQIPNATNLTYFDFNADESIVKRLTGAVKEEYKDIIRNATGSTNLKFATDCEPSGLCALCARLLNIYKLTDYEQSFPDIHNIVPIKDPDIISSLNNKLLEDFRSESRDLTLCVPEIIDYTTNYKVTYRGARASDEFDDVYIGNYREYLKKRKITTYDVSTFKKHLMCIQDENGNVLQTFSIYKSFLYDCQFNDKTYHLCEGNWYEINATFIHKLQNELNPYFANTHDILCECDQEREDEYNNYAKEHSPKNLEVHCLDKQNIAPRGQRNVEPCDLIANSDGKAELIHNKISTRSASLSHLFNQGVNSVMLLRENQEAKENLKKLVNDSNTLKESIESDKYMVTFGIISNKPRDLKSKALPLFSQISLLRSIKALRTLKIPTKVFLIKDNVNRKHIEVDETSK